MYLIVCLVVFFKNNKKKPIPVLNGRAIATSQKKLKAVAVNQQDVQVQYKISIRY